MFSGVVWKRGHVNQALQSTDVASRMGAWRDSQNIRPFTCITGMLVADFPRGDDSEPELEAQKARFLVSRKSL